MSLTYDLKLPNDKSIRFEQGFTFENFISQFQSTALKLLCIVDGTELRFYDKPESLPKNIRFDYKQTRNNITEYYFRDIYTETLYCVFGKEAASIFYPRLNEKKELRRNKTPDYVTIIDNGHTLTFEEYNLPVNVMSHN